MNEVIPPVSARLSSEDAEDKLSYNAPKSQVFDISPQEYLYEPLDTSLDSMRLLVLTKVVPHPSQSEQRHNTTPVGRLIHTTFEDRPKYVALSYMWGSTASSKEIILDGIKVKVMENLYWALFYM